MISNEESFVESIAEKFDIVLFGDRREIKLKVGYLLSQGKHIFNKLWGIDKIFNPVS